MYVCASNKLKTLKICWTFRVDPMWFTCPTASDNQWMMCEPSHVAAHAFVVTRCSLLSLTRIFQMHWRHTGIQVEVVGDAFVHCVTPTCPPTRRMVLSSLWYAYNTTKGSPFSKTLLKGIIIKSLLKHSGQLTLITHNWSGLNHSPLKVKIKIYFIFPLGKFVYGSVLSHKQLRLLPSISLYSWVPPVVSASLLRVPFR